jgi:hypothetical protein
VVDRNGACGIPRENSESLRRSIAKQSLAFPSQKTTDNRNIVIALLEDHPAGDQAGSPFVFFGAALAAVGGDVFL